ncbi:MAG: hypothetical protein JO175_03140 [Candidatus Eremiobacteraeota bacterium]|nr:hypothetical protein [Candidatus Eremiobacteraeota bacterium]
MYRSRIFLAAAAAAALAACSGPTPGISTVPAANGAAPAHGVTPVQVAGSPKHFKHPHASNAIVNGGFETGDLTGWSQCGTVNAAISTVAHSGTYSARMGTTRSPEINGDSAICQSVSVPAGGQLTFWIKPATDDTISYAWQTAQLLDSSGSVLQTFYKTATTSSAWEQMSYDLSAYAGQQVTLKFAVHGNGYAYDYVDQYVDDVSLLGSGGPSPSPSPTASPSPSPSASPTHSPSPSPSPTTKPSTSPSASPTPVGSSPIKHVVIILQENRSTDDLFHGYPGLNYATTGQDHNGNPVALQAVPLMNAWDPAHHYADWNTEYNGGAMNGFDLDKLDYGSGAPADFAYDYAQQSDVQPYWNLAQLGVVTDDSFVDHRSESYSGHLYPIASASGPVSPSQPNIYFSEDPSGTAYCGSPSTAKTVNIQTGIESGTASTCMNIQTMADLLNAKGVSWKYYVASADKDAYVSAYSQIQQIYGSSYWTNNVITPETTVLSDAQAGTLPAVSWVIGTFANSDHDGQNVPSSNGPNWVTSVANAIGQGPDWNSTAIFITWDDWGGWYDHVKPPVQFDAFEPGFRVPIIVLSPYVARGTVNHDLHFTSSILHYIETNFGLGSLGKMDARADAFADIFNYTQSPLPYLKRAMRPGWQRLVDSDLPWYGRDPIDPDDRD